jgi:hypothetical protein
VPHLDLIGPTILTQSFDRRLTCDRLEIGPNVPIGDFGDLPETHVRCQRRVLRVDFEDLLTSRLPGMPDHDEAVEPTTSNQGGIDHIRPVRRTDDHHCAILFEPIELRQQLIDHAFGDVRTDVPTSIRCECIELIEEHHRRCDLPRLPEGLSDRTL